MRAGMMIARGEQVLMADADGATRWEDLELLQGRMQELLKKQSESRVAWMPRHVAGHGLQISTQGLPQKQGCRICCRRRVRWCQSSPLQDVPTNRVWARLSVS